jgi:hypothetical protein
MTKRRFTNKGRSILGERDRPIGIADVLGEKDAPFHQESETPHQTPDDTRKDPVKAEVRKTVKTENRKTGSTLIHDAVKTGTGKTVKPDETPEELELPPKREEFKLPGQLAERLRVYVFDTRSKKTHVVIDALDEYLQKRGY